MSVRDEWQKLYAAYEKEGLVLVLGAGVPHGCELPDWETLLRRLAKRCWEADGEDVFDRLKAEGYTFPAIASMLESQFLNSGQDFRDAVREELYRNFPYGFHGAGLLRLL